MKKKLCLVLLLIATCALCLVGVSACSEDDGAHTHTFSAMVEEVPSTCATAGTKAHKTCSSCNKNFDADGNEITDLSLPLASHTLGELVEEVSATCSTTGTKAHKTCSVCEKNFDENDTLITDLTISTLAHTFGDLVDEVPASCTQVGTKAHKTCSVCEKDFDANGNLLESLEIEKTAHYFSALKAEAPATCQETGTKAYKTCYLCDLNYDANGNLLEDLILAIVDHDFGTWLNEQPATCTQVGTKAHKTCSLCSKNFDAENIEITSLSIPKTPHSFGAWTNKIPSTLTTTGTKGYKTCSLCELNYDTNGVVIEDLTIPSVSDYLTGKKLSVLGDSISTFSGVSNTNTVNSTISSSYYVHYSTQIARTDTWWQQAVDTYGMELLVNNSYSSSGVTDVVVADCHPAGRNNAWDTRCVNLHDNTLSNNPNEQPINPDVIAVFMGTNDVWNGSNSTTTWDKAFFDKIEADGFTPTSAKFDEAYALMIYKMTKAYKDADIFCFTLMVDAGTNTTKFNSAIKAIAEHYGCGVVDLYNTPLFSSGNADTSVYKMDTLHPNAAGMDIITDAFYKAIVEYL